MKIRVFTEFSTPYNVEQDESAIAPLGMELFTNGMSGCCALIIKNTEKILLAHTDANTNVRSLAKAIDEHFKHGDEKLKITIAMGSNYPRVSGSKLKITQAINTSTLKSSPCSYFTNYKNVYDDLVINEKGEISIREDPHKKEPNKPGSLEMN